MNNDEKNEKLKTRNKFLLNKNSNGKLKTIKLKYIYFLVLAFIFTVTYIWNVEKFTPIENLDVPIGVGYDFISTSKNGETFSIPISVYKFSPVSPNATPAIMTGVGDTIGVTRSDRQTKSNRKFILGTEKVLLISDEIAEKTIHHAINVLFNSPYVNDRAKVCIVKGKAKDALKLKVKGYESAADYIEGMIADSVGFNFFSKEYSMTDTYMRLDAEGKNVCLPYIIINNGEIKINGVAIFNKYKLVKIFNIDETKTLNMLRENNVTGVVTLTNKKGQVTDFSVKAKRNIKCEKNGEKYKFIINLNLKGDIIENTMYKNISFNDKIIGEIRKDVETRVKELATEFIKKMQDEVKIDCIELGKVAVAKYGRRKDVNWNKVVSESDIVVNVKFKLDRIGRGIY